MDHLSRFNGIRERDLDTLVIDTHLVDKFPVKGETLILVENLELLRCAGVVYLQEFTGQLNLIGPYTYREVSGLTVEVWKEP